MEDRRPYFAVVRRGNTEVFDFLWQRHQGPRLVQVIWDRRRADRRTDGDRRTEPAEAPEERRRADRRQADRRQSAPLSWPTLGFAVAPWTRKSGA